MGTYVTTTGFQKKTLAEIKTELETAFQDSFGDDIDLDASGAIGQLIGLLSKREADLWDGAGEIYTSRNPNEAEGTSLDNIASETGIVRIDASPTTVNNVLLTGDEGAVIPAGSQARQVNGTLTYSLLSEVEITIASARRVVLSFDTPGGAGEDYIVTINGTAYTHTTLISDGVADVIDGLVTLITAGSWSGTASNVDDEFLLLYDETTDFATTYTANMELETLASAGQFECDTDGENPLPASSLNTIVTPVTGWDEITNPQSGITGRDEETDAELRIRRLSSLFSGYATEDSIKAAIQNDVSGVSRVIVASNRTLSTDGEGRPAKSFEVVVSGGSDEDIAEKIWEVQPAGIQSYGNDSETVVDSEGNNQTVYFSRPESVYIHVQVSRDLYSEEDYPADGDTAIKTAIVDWALDPDNIDIGKDVIRQRLSIPVYTVPGISDILIELDSTPNPGDSPTFAEQNIEIAARELAVFDAARITVQDLTP